MYRITISTKEHGTILDQDLMGFVLIRKMLCEHEDPTHEPVMSMESRGLNGYEQIGLLEWAKAVTTADMVADMEEGPGLADYPN